METKTHLSPLLHGEAFGDLCMAEQHQEERLRLTYNPRKMHGVCPRHTQGTYE